MIKSLRFKPIVLLAAAFAMGLTACDDDDDNPSGDNTPTLTVPSSYEFTRNGASTVSYQGQIDRLNHLIAIKDKLKMADAGNQISGQDLLDMFANTNGDGGGNFAFSSTKQLKDKTFSVDHGYFETLMQEAANASGSNVTATNGTAGLLTRGNGNTILVDANGREYTQLIEKGLMGATFLHQIFNTYLTDDRLGDQVDNTNLVSGQNYTSMEHHLDEAFGYFGAPIDFSSNYTAGGSVVFWANYSNGRDNLTGSNDKIMTAFRTARAAIAANQMATKDQQRDVLYEELEKLAAAVAIHYANSTLSATNDGDRLHFLSECYAFTRALRYANTDYRKLTQAEVDDLLANKIGTNFWLTTTTGLNELKDLLSSRYGLDAIKNDL